MSGSKAYDESWLQLINQPEWNKLHTYCLFKSTFEAELYVQNIQSRQPRGAFAKFKCEVAPSITETGRYRNIPVERGYCTLSHNDSIKSKAHILLHCDFYYGG